MIAHVGAAAVSLLIGYAFLRGLFKYADSTATDDYSSTGDVLKASIPFLGIGLMHVVNENMDALMLGVLMDAADVGIYKVVHNASRLFMFIMVSVDFVIAPLISKLYDKNELVKLQKLLARITGLVVLIILPPAVIVFIFSKGLINLIYGPAYVSGAAALILLTIDRLIGIAVGPTNLLPKMTGHEKYSFWSGVGTAILRVILNFILIPAFGIIGAAVANIVTTSVISLYLIIMTYKDTGLFAGIPGFIWGPGQLMDRIRSDEQGGEGPDGES
jgi:O-antigen/teichoic acid export membrane protein